LEDEHEKEVDADLRKALVFCKVKWKKLSRRRGLGRLQKMVMYLEM
jgi:hypothetical protein